MHSSPPLFADPFANSCFDSVPDLWAAYAKGYLVDAMSPTKAQSDLDHDTVFIIVRFEDIVLTPGDVINSLARLGLPRSTQIFEPIEESVSGDSGGRASVVSRLRQECQHNLDSEKLATFRELLAPHSDLLENLGYIMP